MKKVLIILLVALISCKSSNKGFTITGITSDFADSTQIYLRNSSNILDSTMILNNRFELKGFVDSIEQFTIHTKDFKDYKILWVDNSSITLDASKSRLRLGKISGSPFQNLNSEYQELDSYQKIELENLNSIISATEKTDSIRFKKLQWQRDSIVIQKQNAILNFMRNNPDFYLNPFYLTFLMHQQPVQVTKNMYDAISKSSQNSKWGKAVYTYINHSIELKIGDKAIDFSLPDIKGNQITLSSFNNKYVLLEFWASWCGPCRQENPNLLENYREFRDDGFEILGVSLDERKDVWHSTIQSDTLLWTTVCDLKGNLGEVPVMYRVNGIPKNYLINPQGLIIDIDLRGTALKNKLQTVLGN